ncbi:hypothetical protein ACG33_00860 [Steroidobacter denitrificans]|uniref:Uncharacterized protein n=2 Tax=Steroidobacter denitrificans TaxID=465721 RepID=A0A127F7V5_STEDE|nr:hypothetical protein ACG33_00860 [Steroidobacter denitrificans]
MFQPRIFRKRMQVIRNGMLRVVCSFLTGLTLAMVAGCGPVRLVVATNIPTPLIVKIPMGVALFIPAEFSQYVHMEERWSTNWHIDLGQAQTDGITRLLQAMFERVVIVDSLNSASHLDAGIRVILEPNIEEYAFVTPRDAGSQFFAVSIKYRVNVYLPDGKLADSWRFTGYGSLPSRGLSSEAPLAAATALAMRDAGAKLAVEFREQAVMRGLLSRPEAVDTSGVPAGFAAGSGVIPESDQKSMVSDELLPQSATSAESSSESPAAPKSVLPAAPPSESPVSGRQFQPGRPAGKETSMIDVERTLLAEGTVSA